MTSKELYTWLKENGYILLETLVGSHSYGLNIETSDEDFKFVYILPEEHILGNKYVDFIKLNDDYCGYEIKRFLELVSTNNPTVIELLNPPADCIQIKHPLFDLIIENRDKFITKGCASSFNGYATQQIKKAQGQEKMQNWEGDKIQRKSVIDFCYVIDGHKTIPLTKWLHNNNMVQKFCGVVNIPNARDLHALYYDLDADKCFNQDYPESIRETNKDILKSQGKPFGYGYKGIIKIDDGESNSESNQLRLSSAPKGEKVQVIFSYNKDGYISHCRDFKKYQSWKDNHNKERYIETPNGDKIDAKNMMHCVRLIGMAEELAAGKGLIIRRPNREELLDIRRGKVNLEELIEWSEAKLAGIREMFKTSDLPNKVDRELVHNLLVEIRTKFYNSKK